MTTVGSPQKRNTIDGGGFATEKERDWLAQRRTKNARRYPCGHVPRHARAQRQFRLRHGVLGQAGLGGQGQIRPGDRSGRAKAWGRVVLACAESRPNRTLHRPPTPHPSAAAGPRSPPTPTHPHCGVLPVPGDDARFQHHVCFPRHHEEGYNPEGVRFTIVLRWCRGVREYDPYTHRNKTGAAVANPEEFTL